MAEEEPVRLFVGCATQGDDAEAQAVFEYSVRRHSSLSIDLTWLIADTTPELSGWDRSGWATPFSGFRWVVPELCKFTGRAIYADSDIIVRSDIAELWNLALAPGKVVASRGGWRFCVCVWDCAPAQAHVPLLAKLREGNGHRTANRYFVERPDLAQRFDPRWNWVDTEDNGPISSAKALHYSGLFTQPSRVHAVKRLSGSNREHWWQGPVRKHSRPEVCELFDAELDAAQRNGYPVGRYL
jgi:hypothetical protein